MAEAMVKQKVEQAGLEDWTVESAGTWAGGSFPASRYAVEVMRERGLDLSYHRSRPVDEQMMEQADLVLVMTQSHSEILRLEFVDQWDKVYLLSEMKTGRRFDVDDPYGGPLAEYQVCADEIADLVGGGWQRIQVLAAQNSQARDTADHK
jgi:protein-tyrosine-phosphatase